MRYSYSTNDKIVWRLIICLALILLIHRAGVALAASKDTTADSCTIADDCNSLVQRALLSSQQMNYSEALRLYQGALAIQPEPRLLVSIGRMQQKLGRVQEARSNYKKFLDISTRPDDEPYRTKASQWLIEIETQSTSTVSPIYKKWWFWTVTGTVLAGSLALGFGLGLTPAPHETATWTTR